MLEASAYPMLLNVIRERVLPDWTRNAEKERQRSGKDTGEHQNRLNTWWGLKRARLELQDRMSERQRIIACSAVMKRNIFVFLSTDILSTNAIKAFLFDDDYSFGILQSDTHWQWFVAKCSKLKSDFRYTPQSVFDTFPWPQGPDFRGPTSGGVEAVAAAGREVRRVRDEALTRIKGGLRAVYRTLELPGKNPLKDAHAALDAAVLDAYGFPPGSDVLQSLLDLNRRVARRETTGQQVTPPGIPPGYAPTGPKRSTLVTDDCIVS